MARNQLPEGVGKKIVEALKRQAEADITPVSNIDEPVVSKDIPLTDIRNESQVYFEPLKEDIDYNDNLIVEEDSLTLPIGTFKEKEEEKKEDPIVIPSEPIIKENISIKNEPIQPVYKTQTTQVPNNHISFGTTKNISIPANVATLKNLIASLPVGVTKQTGAQIIRQTLEAMGLPMNNVLKEAQEVQEELNSSSRECLLKIQEYKTNILQLEQSVQEYQKNITQINDLVSLFLLTDRR